MGIFSGAVFFDFAYFREQTCLVACPYGRWQSALLDRQSLIVAYDYNRGEPRGKGKQRYGLGACVDCGQCVAVCPTGIDIRNGLQMECIHCTQCMDACDAVMDKVGQPRGLVRYTSRAALEGAGKRFLRARTVLYPLAFSVFFGGFLYALGTKDTADVTLLGSTGTPFTVDAAGLVVNQVRIKIANRSGDPQAYRISLHGVPEATMIAPMNPLRVEPGRSEMTSVFVTLPAEEFTGGVRTVTFHVSAGDGFAGDFAYRLAGPVHVPGEDEQ
jgi:cytochrome c oxidase accessory protein FixG